MNHDEARAQVTALFEGRQGDVQREALREHLKGCESCRGDYDRTAVAMRRMLGAADEMTEEELWLFEPPLPAAKVVPLFRPGRAVAFAIAATLAAAVIWYSSRTPDEFSMRGGPTVEVAPSARAVCMRGSDVVAACADGDTVLFAASARGLTHVTLSDGAQVIGEGDVPDAVDAPLPWTVPFRAGMQLSVHFAKCAGCDAKVVKVAP